MATQVQFRRGTTTQNNAFTGAIAEITYDTEVKTFRIHDGATPGGGAILINNTSAQTLTNKTLSTNSVWNGQSVGLGYGGTGASLSAASGAVAYSTNNSIGFTGVGSSGQLLVSSGSGVPSWVSPSSITAGTSSTAVTATNLAGGSAGYLPYQADTGTTSFIAPGAAGTFLISTGASSAPSWAAGQITIGSTTVSLGSTSTSLSGLTAIDSTSGATSFFATPTAPALFAAGTAVTIGATTGTTTIRNSLVVTGDLTINGTTTTINSTVLNVDDILIELGAVTTPTDTTANGGGLSLLGTTNKTILYDNTNNNWTSSENWNIASGKVFKINNVSMLSSTALGSTVVNSSLTSVGTIGTGVWQGTIVGSTYGGTGVNNGASTLTLAGSVTHAGAFTRTFTATAATSLTLPTTGTLATLAGTETFTNKTLTSPTINSASSSNTTLTGTLTAGGAVGTNGYFLQTTGTGIQWAQAAPVVADDISTNATRYINFTSVTSGTTTTFNTASTKLTFNPSTGLLNSTGVQTTSLGVNTVPSSTPGEIRATGTITGYYSDDRLKTRTGNIQNALEKVLSLDGFHYYANETAAALGYDSSKQEVGLSAQQVQAVLPEIVVPAPIDDTYLTIHYERMIPLLVEAIKEQQKQIEELKAKLGN